MMLFICSIFLLIVDNLNMLSSSLSFAIQDKFIKIFKYKFMPYALLIISLSLSFFSSFGLNFW